MPRKSIEWYDRGIKIKVLTKLDDVITDIISKNASIYNQRFIYKKLEIKYFLWCSSQSYFSLRKDIRLNTTQFFIMKIPNSGELQQTAIDHSSDIDFNSFKSLHKNLTVDLYLFLVTDTTLSPDNPILVQKNLLGSV